MIFEARVEMKVLWMDSCKPHRRSSIWREIPIKRRLSEWLMSPALNPIQSLWVALHIALHIHQRLNNVDVAKQNTFLNSFISLTRERPWRLKTSLPCTDIRQLLSAFRAIRSALIGFSLVVLQNSLSGANANFLTLKDFSFNYTRYGWARNTGRDWHSCAIASSSEEKLTTANFSCR